MNIGFLSYWFERGQAYVTRSLIDAIGDHEVFILARSSGPDMTRSDGEWAHPNLSGYPEYVIPVDILQKWIADNNIGIMFFNEEYDFELVKAVRDSGVKTIGIYYWELFNPAWALIANQVYDVIICPTRCSYEKFHKLGMDNIEYVPWGVDLNIFKPIERKPNGKIRFFHPAGWGGVHNRRGTEFVIEAFRKLDNPNAELSIHSQKDLGLECEKGISVITGTIPRDMLVAMYQAHDVAVLPSKWEGIGLTFLESLACGLPVITVGAPPMNEFVKHGYSGLCVDGNVKWYGDIYVPGIHVYIDGMADIMQFLCDNEFTLQKMKKSAADYARRSLDWNINGEHFWGIIHRLAGDLKTETSYAIQSVSDMVDHEYSTPVDDRLYKRYSKIMADEALYGDILEIGCKHGTLPLMLADVGSDVVGVDSIKGNIEICKQLAFEEKSSAQFHHAAIHSLPFPDDFFDTIIMSKVLEHIENPEDLSEVVRVLRPSGTIILVTNLGFAHWDADHKWFFMPKDTHELMKYGWFFKAFPMEGKVVAFEDFIEEHFGLSCGYQVYNEHESEYDSLEIYCHLYGKDADFSLFPELRGETIHAEMPLSRYEVKEIAARIQQ